MPSMDTRKSTIRSSVRTLLLVTVIGLCGTSNVTAATPSSWAQKDMETIKSINLVTDTLTEDYQKVLERETFTELLVKTYEAVTDESIDISTLKNPFTDTKESFILKAYTVGITKGITDSLFAPDGTMTREQMVVMFIRMIEQIEAKNNVEILDPTLEKVVLADGKEISSWAKNDIDLAVSNNIIKITENKKVNPSGYSTGEQALIINYRMVRMMIAKDLLKTDWVTKLANYKDDTSLEINANASAAELSFVEGVVVANVLNLRSDPSLNGQTNVIKQLKAYEKVVVLEEINEWYKASAAGEVTGYVHKRFIEKYDPNKPVESKSVDDVITQISNYAKKYIGTPYKAGGSSLTNGVDCSGFTTQIFRQYGYILPRTASSQYSNSKSISEGDLKPGDLVFYGYKGLISHVSMYIGDGQIIHAVSKGVKITNMKGYMNKPLIGFGRVIF